MKVDKRKLILKAVEEVIKTKRFHEVKMEGSRQKCMGNK